MTKAMTKSLVPTDKQLEDFAVEEQFLLFCDADEFTQIARAVLAKWGTPPAVAGEPVAWMGTYDKTDLYYRKPPQADVVPLYATPQPTQAQAWAVPLTDEQIKDEASHHGFIGSTEMLVKFVRGIESAHGIGIKGGQHGAE